MKANYNTKEEKTKVSGSFEMSLYEMNKQVISQLPALTAEVLSEKYSLIDQYGSNRNWCMLLGKEIDYYTIFHHLPKDAEETFAAAVLDCCENLGSIKAIDWADEEHNAVEIWISKDELTTVLYLFDYSQGVIECQM